MTIRRRGDKTRVEGIRRQKLKAKEWNTTGRLDGIARDERGRERRRRGGNDDTTCPCCASIDHTRDNRTKSTAKRIERLGG